MLNIGPDRFVLPGNRWDLLAGVTPAEPPSVSVVIAYFQAQRQLDLVLTALRLQTHPQARLEVIVADDGSAQAPDTTAAGELTITTVRQDNLGFRAAAARNLGARHASGEVLCFLDNDTIPEPGYLEQLCRLPALAPDAIVTGRRRHAELADFNPDRLEAWLKGGAGPVELEEPAWLVAEHRRTDNLLRIDADSYRYVISAVLACSRSLFNELGGFDQSLIGYGGEDWELAHRALCAGAVLAHVPAAVAWHDGPSWALRGDAEARRVAKNAETAALLARIPRPDQGIWAARPAIAVTMHTTDEEAAAVIIAVQGLLTAGINCGIRLIGDCAADLKRNQFRDDDRIAAGPFTRSDIASTPLLIELSRPLLIAASGWRVLREQVWHGAVIIDTGDGTLTAICNAAQSRAQRWSGVAPERDLVSELYGRISLQAREVGVAPVPRHPDLNRELTTLQRQ